MSSRVPHTRSKALLVLGAVYNYIQFECENEKSATVPVLFYRIKGGGHICVGEDWVGSPPVLLKALIISRMLRSASWDENRRAVENGATDLNTAS